ncbi:transcriptional regulator [Denitratisoma sp. DHT3]|uniref:transcriptional regulator n=1 Tax=Denitratisoma sp. DHT3 TaxID=1981880 RepID=UPI001198589B|nr:transcriptional regulator [Denitratisoma sp. DHT3]QDX79810.1 transcriptional regulator [Denitratisoma sp. DHT3]QDX82764.1 transcriptional regulator [Denitratisoma sp. DHT3]
MDEKAEFSQRLRKAMENAGYPLRPIVLEREFNIRYWGRAVTVQAVRRWLRGEAIPSQEKLQVLADWLKVEPHVLRFGESAINSVREKKKRWDATVGYQEREVFEAFLSLPAPQRKILREVILTFAQVHTGAEKPLQK